ncbi:MAG: hypothetical protein KA133_06765 [Flavobacterium sp.]|jgi:hypothetical protein|nr:hypothetical protein [Flavobacterium sp.]
MDISATKLELIELLLHTQKDHVLEKVREILENQNEEIVGYSVLGEPLSEDLYNKKLQKSEEALVDERIISQVDLKKKYGVQK